jgi:hypothetical protein
LRSYPGDGCRANCRKRVHNPDFLTNLSILTIRRCKNRFLLHEKGETLHTIPGSPPDFSKPIQAVHLRHAANLHRKNV